MVARKGLDPVLVIRRALAEESLEESRYYLILSEDLKYGETGKLLDSLEEVNRLHNAYSKAILDSSSDSSNPCARGFQGAKPVG